MEGEQRLTLLIERSLSGLATEAEQEELAAMLRSDDNSHLFKTVLAQMMRDEEPALPGDGRGWQQMAESIVEVDRPGGKLAVMGRRIRWRRWAAAAVITGLAAGGYLFWAGQQRKPLSLAEDVHTTVSTENSRLREITLPDGTHVWLNAGSTIDYPVKFNGRERSVRLYGEAFFDVQHADKTPFVIYTGTTVTTVLGTSFDLAAYPRQSNITVSVQTGKVKVQTGEKVLAILEKGRQVRVSADTVTYEKSIDTTAIAAWRAGDLVYRDEQLEDVIADLGRAFNDSVEIKRTEIQKVKVTFSINKKTGLQHALEMICRITGGRLSHEQGKFTIE